MVVLTSSQRRRQSPNLVEYSRYRCSNGSTGDCPSPVVISAAAADKAVLDATRRLLRGLRGSASMVDEIEEADRAVEQAQALLDAAVDAFDGISGDRAKQKLRELQAAADEAESHRDRLAAAAGPMLTVPISGELDSLSLEEQRRFVRLAIHSAVVGPATGGDPADRITITARTSLAE
jgi:acyl-CoA reductase-like NAD-dependent aldehyde dehydrogenase